MCVFCDIIRKKVSAEIIYEDGTLIAFNDASPKAPLHILIAPKKHIESIKDTDKHDELLLGKIIGAARVIAKDKSLNGYRLIFNVGREGGQIVDHLHLHLLGGWNQKDGIMKKSEV